MDTKEINNKLFSLDGILGRRDFLVNLLSIHMIKLLILTVIFYITLVKINLINIFITDTYYVVVLRAILGFIVSLLLFPSIVRRVRDISDIEDNNKLHVISAFLAFFIFSGSTPLGQTGILDFLSVFIVLALLFFEGKVTSKLPKSEVIKFNWGAFWGSWIWGIVNKVPRAILALPLFFTFAWIPYILICGLKGNEWVYERYKNKDEQCDLEKFHITQKVHSFIMFILAPAITLICVFATSVIIAGTCAKFVGIDRFLNALDTRQRVYESVMFKSEFNSIEITKDEYKFYVDPQYWIALPETHKKSLMMIAKDYVLTNTEFKKENRFEINKVKEIEVLNKLKIYSTFNNEVLAEFYLNPKNYVDTVKDDNKLRLNNIKASAQIISKGCKLNNEPSLP